MYAGMLDKVGEPGAYMTPETRKMLGLKLADYVEVYSEVRGTQVCRKLRDITCPGCAGGNYVYLDRDSLHLLDIDLHERLAVCYADMQMDFP